MLANALLTIAQMWAEARNKELAVIISEHSIDVCFEKPGNNWRRVWDKDFYARNNLFVAGIAQALRISPSEVKGSDVDVMLSDKLETFMEQTLAREAFNASAIQDERMLYLLVASVGINVLVLLAVVMSAVS